MFNLDDVLIPDELIKNVVKNIEYNNIIAEYYEKLDIEVTGLDLIDKAERIKECNKFWIMDKYEKQKILDYKKTFLCKDKFCNNCKKVKQASRMARFIPYLEQYKSDLYLLTLTVPNVFSNDLRTMIKTIFKAYKRLVEYLNLKKRIKGIDFSKFNYKGSIRSLEVTFNEDGTYHPHLHIAIVLDGYKGSIMNIINKYSYDYNVLKRLFSEDEILIQKVWRLLIDGKEVNKKNIDELDIGYSCTLDKFYDTDYAEIFKYMTKATNDKDKVLTYDNFKTLYFSLYNVRQIQGYGCFYNIKDIDVNDEIDSIYDEIINELLKIENPLEVSERPKDLLNSDYRKISRKQIYKYLKDLK